jgi:NADH:ubiquinone oxidoreductase subunit K
VLCAALIQVWAVCFHFVMVLLCLVYYTIQGQALVYFTSSLALAQVRLGLSVQLALGRREGSR